MHLKWPGLTAENTLIIRVDRSNFDIRSEGLEFVGKLFRPKPETHITILGSTSGRSLSDKLTGQPDREEIVRKAFETTDWSYRLTTDLRHLLRPGTDTDEESIIVLLDMKGMARFHNELKRLDFIDRDLPLPPAHVTLYTFNCDFGIGVHSKKQLDELTAHRMEGPL